MAAVGGFPGQDHSHELKVYLGAYATPKAEPVEVKPTVMLAVGEVKSAVGQLDTGGWSWGDSSGGQWLTIPGSANTRPRLGASPGTAYLCGPKQADMNTVCAFVVPVAHSGVSTGIAFRILQLAEPRELDLETVLAYEDQEEDAGVLDGGQDRTTCHGCRTWATEEHLSSDQHRTGEVSLADFMTAIGEQQ